VLYGGSLCCGGAGNVKYHSQLFFSRDRVRDGAHLSVWQVNLYNHGLGNGHGSGNDTGTITDGITDPSAFSRITDGIMDAKNVCGKALAVSTTSAFGTKTLMDPFCRPLLRRFLLSICSGVIADGKTDAKTDAKTPVETAP
jgi:hypothetical protein